MSRREESAEEGKGKVKKDKEMSHMQGQKDYQVSCGQT